MGSKTLHASGATPGGMQVKKATVAWGGSVRQEHNGQLDGQHFTVIFV
jgi:hypothetical protein